MSLSGKVRITTDLRVGIGALLAKGGHDIDQAPVVLHLPLGSACLLLFLLFGHLCPLTWPARAGKPWTLAPSMWPTTSRVVRTSTPCWSMVASSLRDVPARSTTWCSRAMSSSEAPRALIWVTWLVTSRVCSSWAQTELHGSDWTGATTATISKMELRKS